MRILITADWQASFDNLDLCKIAADEVIRLSGELGFTVVVVAGDLKQIYNPVDLRVIKFWMSTIVKWKKAGLEVFINLGNHDRIGMHVDKQNWLPILRRAGAIAFDDPQHAGASTHGAEIAFLPFRQNPVLLKREAHDLSKKADGNSILIFHADLKNARYNVLSRSESAEMTVEDLIPDRYMFCIGGHIHFQHKVAGNVWYVGSPFATDWGEANQKKGYLLVDTEKRTIKKIPSGFPGWYDPSWPGFEEAKPKSWKDAKVRIKVPCSGVQHVKEALEKAYTEAVRRYGGADIVVVPEFNEGSGERTGKIGSNLPDEKKIQLYVKETLPDELKRHEQQIRKFLVEQLSLVGGLQRESGELAFDRVRAENFLSFNQLDVRFRPGLSVVAGDNQDWKGRSNGAGKSSYLQPVAVALFGQTFKGQKHDGWMRRGTGKKEVSWVKVRFRDAQGRYCSVLRSRRPRELKLVVGKEIVESGNRPESTQKLIEQVTGYTWETLANAIYVDQAKSHLMLTGTEAERKGFLAKLQNLERFERAEKSIKTQKQDLESRYEAVSIELQSVLTEENNLSQTLRDTRRILAVKGNISVSYKRLRQEYLEKKARLLAREAKAEKAKEKLEGQIQECRQQEKHSIGKISAVRTKLEAAVDRLNKLNALAGVCETCLQPIDEEYMLVQLPLAKETVSKSKKLLAALEANRGALIEKEIALISESQKYESDDKLSEAVVDLKVELGRKRAEWEQYQKQQELLAGIQKKIDACQQKSEGIKEKKKKIGKWLSVLKYSQTVFQRNGLPAYLNQQICPELNQAAQEYAELFAQSEIQVRFAVDEEGRLDIQVVNAHGGELVEDQSEGEMKMASLITSFAVRSVAPKTNLLILDEPGAGLDATSARSFARGLRKVVNRFSCILLTTHNQSILSELADVELVTVRKKNRVSEVVE